MTAYQGGKQRLGKEIYRKILEIEEKLTGGNSLPYMEPFCGMCGVMKHFAKDTRPELLAYDLNEDLILMWQALQNGWEPPENCSREEYFALRESKEHSPERGFLGVVCSWGGQFMHTGYRIIGTNGQNFLLNGKKTLLNIIQYMLLVNYKLSDYSILEPSGYLIYCDPPYKNNTLQSRFFKNFNHEEFWELMRQWSKTNIVVISEKIAPDDFVCIWTKEYNINFYKKTQKTTKYRECLFIHNSL